MRTMSAYARQASQNSKVGINPMHVTVLEFIIPVHYLESSIAANFQRIEDI